MKRSYVAAVLVAVLVNGCGGGNEGSPTAVLNIFPAAIKWDTTNLTPAGVQRQSFVISLTKSGTGAGRDVNILLDLSAGTGGTVMTLRDQNFNVQTSPFTTQTDGAGQITVYVDYAIGGRVAYKGALQAFSGPAFDNSTIEVTCAPVAPATSC